MPTHNIIPSVDIDTSRPTVTNWKNQVKAIVDGYISRHSISHGVQKDAIQNGWDARLDKRHAKDWLMTFELLKGKDGRIYFVITDSGTTGLTGRVLRPEELQADLPSEERWGRFENVAFTKNPEEEALDARGRGKFIFVGASKDYVILYDTLRLDGSYRFGFRIIELTDSRVNSFDDEEGRKRLEQYTSSTLKPLSSVGTRVIIVNPIDEIIDSVKSGEFLRYIEETWWEIIERCGVKIYVHDGKDKKLAKIPKEFILQDSDNASAAIWKKDNVEVNPGNEQYRIKHMHFVCSLKKEIPEDIRGIAIQRGGMKICSIPIKYVPANITNSIYGYVSFDRDLEIAMQKEEDPDHYSFSFRKSVPSAVKRKIEDELERFAREKLGIGVSPEERRKEMQSSAEKKAVYAVNRILKQLGLTGIGILPLPPKPPKPPKPTKALRLEMSDLEFPREIRRLNYGERLKGAELAVFNDSEDKIVVNVKMYMVKGDLQIGEHFYNDDIELMEEESFKIPPLDLELTREKLPTSGKYSIRAKMVAIKVNGQKKGTELHKIAKSFYLEEDPPESGLFEKCEAISYGEDEELVTIMGEAIPGEEQGYIFQYNTDHPSYEVHSGEELTDYLVQIMAAEVPRIILRTPNQELFSQEDIEQPEQLSRKISLLQGKILYSYFKG